MAPPDPRRLTADLCRALGIEDLSDVFKVELVMEVDQFPKLLVHRHKPLSETLVHRVADMRLSALDAPDLRAFMDGAAEADHAG